MDSIPVNQSHAGWLRVNGLVALALLVLGCIYVSQAWSPSSYGHVLKIAGATETGLVWGQPRPIRSDEWSVTTPLTQATVRNDFERYNQTSFYVEDLRSNYSLPLHDWGMAFKPNFWLYGWAPAAYAFSWHYWVMFALFIFGYAHLFRLTGASGTQSFLFSTALYYTGFVQFFWNSNTSLFAFFPWLVVVMCAPWRIEIRALLFYWIASCWLIGNFYPPLFISLTLVAACFLWAYRPDLFQRKALLLFCFATVAACGTTVFYLWDYLVQTAATSYPGQRTSKAGYYPWHLFLTHFWPSALFDHDFNASVTYTNVTGVGVAGLYWTVAAICFTHWSRAGLKQLWNDRSQRALLLGLGIVMVWMLAPVPAWIGKFTLLNRVPPERMVYAAGLLIALNVWHASSRLGLVTRHWIGRSFLYFGAVVSGWLAYGFWARPLSGSFEHLTELIAPIVVCMMLWLASKLKWNTTTALIGACALANLLVFGRFNPIQSAWPIFNEPQHAFAETLRKHVSPDGILPVQREGIIGATLNGMGFRAVAHLNVTPQWPIWETKLPSLDEKSIAIFNRYAHIRLIASDKVQLLENDQVGVPSSLFRVPPRWVQSYRIPSNPEANGGQVEQAEMVGNTLIIKGWSAWNGLGPDRELLLVSGNHLAPEGKINFVADQERWDRVELTRNPEALLSGFVLSITYEDGQVEQRPHCIYSRSRVEQPWRSLTTPWQNAACGIRAGLKK